MIKRLTDHEFVIYEPDDCEINRWFPEYPHVSYRKTRLSSLSRLQKALHGQVYWPKELRKERFDIFEGFHLPVVKSPSGLTVLTIHDIGPIREDRGKLNRYIYTKTFERSLKSADHIITVSQAIRSEILDLYPNTPISVVYNGIDLAEYESTTAEEALAVSQKFRLPADFLLAVGHFRKRKNYARLVEALSILHKQGRDIPLVLVGNESGDLPAIRQRIEELGLTRHISIFSNLSDHEVRCIYKLCSLFVFPSAYEGFGIPILESMAAERPMVISDISVFQEITQGQGVYFDHTNPESIATAIDKVLSSSEESERLVEYGNKRVRDFSFENLAVNVESLYQSLTMNV